MESLCLEVNEPIYLNPPLRYPHQDDSGQLQHGAVRRTDPPAGDEGQEHRPRHRPPERPHLPPGSLQEERDHDRSRWEEKNNASKSTATSDNIYITFIRQTNWFNYQLLLINCFAFKMSDSRKSACFNFWDMIDYQSSCRLFFCRFTYRLIN